MSRKLRVGDIVHVPGVVEELTAGGCQVRFDTLTGQYRLGIDNKKIVGSSPRPIAAGDVVNVKTGPAKKVVLSGNVLAVNDKQAWISFPDSAKDSGLFSLDDMSMDALDTTSL